MSLPSWCFGSPISGCLIWIASKWSNRVIEFHISMLCSFIHRLTWDMFEECAQSPFKETQKAHSNLWKRLKLKFPYTQITGRLCQRQTVVHRRSVGSVVVTLHPNVLTSCLACDLTSLFSDHSEDHFKMKSAECWMNLDSLRQISHLLDEEMSLYPLPIAPFTLLNSLDCSFYPSPVKKRSIWKLICT